jgi:hypothetical protein
MAEDKTQSPRHLVLHSEPQETKRLSSTRSFSETVRLSAALNGSAQLRFFLKSIDELPTEDSLNDSNKRYQGTVSVRRRGQRIKSLASAVSFEEKGVKQLIITFSLPIRSSLSKTKHNAQQIYYRATIKKGDKSVEVNRVPYFAIPKNDGCTELHAPQDIKSNTNQESVSLNENLKSALTTTFKVVEVYTDADAQFVSRKSGADGSKIATMSYVNAADQIYRRDSQLILNHKVVNATGEDYQTNSSNTILQLFSGKSLSPSSDAYLLFSGRDFDGYTIGLAWIGGACNTKGYATGLVQELNPAVTHIIFAHELGHLLSAQHDNVFSTRPECLSNFIMGTTLGLNPPSTFSTCSRSSFSSFVNARPACFSSQEADVQPTPTTLPTISPSSTPTMTPTTIVITPTPTRTPTVAATPTNTPVPTVVTTPISTPTTPITPSPTIVVTPSLTPTSILPPVVISVIPSPSFTVKPPIAPTATLSPTPRQLSGKITVTNNIFKTMMVKTELSSNPPQNCRIAFFRSTNLEDLFNRQPTLTTAITRATSSFLISRPPRTNPGQIVHVGATISCKNGTNLKLTSSLRAADIKNFRK